MRPQTGTTSTTGTAPGRPLRAVGVGYASCWVVGLTLGGPDLLPDADASAITRTFAGAPAVVVFALLVHGVAVGFLVALGALLPTGRRRRPSLMLASTAAALSLLQLAGELLHAPVLTWLSVATVVALVVSGAGTSSCQPCS